MTRISVAAPANHPGTRRSLGRQSRT